MHTRRYSHDGRSGRDLYRVALLMCGSLMMTGTAAAQATRTGAAEVVTHRELKLKPGTTGNGQSVQASTEVAQMVRDWERAKAYTKEYLDAMPVDGYGFKPTPEIRSFAQQYLHLMAVNFRYIAAATGRTNPYPGDDSEKDIALQNKATVIDVTMKSYDAAIDALKSITLANLEEKSTLYGTELTKREILLKLFEHQTHHRGQTTIYLRLRGVKPPPERLF